MSLGVWNYGKVYHKILKILVINFKYYGLHTIFISDGFCHIANSFWKILIPSAFWTNWSTAMFYLKKYCNILSKGKKCGFTYSFAIYECRKITFFLRLMPACSCSLLRSCRWQISYNQAFISICVFVLMHIIHEKHAFEEPFAQNAINLSEFVTVRKRPRTQKSPHDEGKLLNGTHEYHWNEGNKANASAQQRQRPSQSVQ